MRGGREAGGHRNFGRGTADPTTHCAPPLAVPGAGGRQGGNEGSGHLGAAGKRHGRTTNNCSTCMGSAGDITVQGMCTLPQ